MADSNAFSLSFRSFQAGRIFSAKVVVFRAALSLSLHCRYHRVLQADGWVLKQAAQAVLLLEQWVRTELAVLMVTAALASTDCRNRRVAWQILGRCMTWLWLSYLRTLNCTKRLSQTSVLKISWGADFDNFQNLSPFADVWNSFLQKQFSKGIFLSSNLLTKVLTKGRCLSQCP